MVKTKVVSSLKILLALDDTPSETTVVNLLTHMKWPAGTSVHMLAVVPEKLPLMDTSPAVRGQVDEATEISRWRNWAAAKILAAETKFKLSKHRFEINKIDICQGHLGNVVREISTELRPDLIAMSGANFSKSAKFLSELTADKFTPNDRPPSVLVVRPSRQICPLNTILAIDGSREAWRAVEFVCNLSLPDWANVTVVSVAGKQAFVSAGSTAVQSYRPIGAHQRAWPAMPTLAESLATEAVSYMRDRGISVRWNCRSGSFAGEIVNLAKAEQADLIVTGTRSAKITKSTHRSDAAQKIANNAPCSVLVVS